MPKSTELLEERIRLARIAAWEAQLDGFTDEALKPLLRSINQAQREIMAELETKMSPYFPDWDEDRALAMVEELGAMTTGIQNHLTGQISEMAGHAGSASLATHGDILSWNGRVPIQSIALTAAQVRYLALDTPVGGRLLEDWVGRTFDKTLVAGIKQEITTGMLKGEGYPDLIKRISEGWDMTRTEAVTLARTYVQSANVGAMQSVYKANQDIVKGERWCATLEIGGRKGGGTCLACSALDSNEYLYPEKPPPCPLHPRCLTPETPIFAPDKIAAFISPYSGPVFEIGLADGRRFTVTANHMLLTINGFAPAKSLRQGDYIISSTLANGPISGISPNYDRYHSRIDEMVEAFAKTPGMTTISMPHATENFHGDGEFIEGNVDVILPESLLRGDFESFFSEYGHKFPFPFTSEFLPSEFSSLCDFYEPLLWLRLATGGFVGSQSVFDVLRSGSVGHHESIGNQTISRNDASFNQSGSDGGPGSLESFGDRVFRFPGEISSYNLLDRQIASFLSDLRLSVNRFDSMSFKNHWDIRRQDPNLLSQFARRFSGKIAPTNIIFIKERFFDGHVYDLQTLTSLYYIDWTISSNCRCVLLPITKTWRELGLPIDEMEQAYRPWTTSEYAIHGGRAGEIETMGFHQGSFSKLFPKMSREDQLAVVGPGRLKLIEAGKVKFADLIDPTTGRLRLLKKVDGEVVGLRGLAKDTGMVGMI